LPRSIRLAFVPLILVLCLRAHSQQPESTQDAPRPELAYVQRLSEVTGISQPANGFNAALTFSGVHDSGIGWYNIATPTVSYVFSPRYSADAGLSIYPYRLVGTQSPPPVQAEQLAATHGDVSDLAIGVHATVYPRNFQYTATLSTTLPTGNRADGLGVGHVTFDFSNYVQRYIRKSGIFLETGVGDSAGLFNRLVPNEDTGLGPIAHFQLGFVGWMFGRNYIQSAAYEQLPVGDQKTYTTVVRPGFPTMTVVSGHKVTEDNGLTTSVGIPLTSHVILTSSYNRSLRLHLDTVSIGMTYSIRARSNGKLSMIDQALREAERPN
jgi:hypothetical protein